MKFVRKEDEVTQVTEKTTPGDAAEGGRTGYDVVVVGAGTAGLSAALVLGRSRRRVLVLDGGEPRNAPASASHGFFTRDGVHPRELLTIGRGQLAPYPSVEHRAARAAEARGSAEAFEVALEGGGVVLARKLLLASGVLDMLPATPGFKELWGRGVYGCPYCHGWEVRDRPLAVLASGGGVLERATLIRNWSRDLVALTDGSPGLGEGARRRLAALGVGLKEERIARLEGDPSDADGGLKRIVFEDGSELERAGLFYVPPVRQRSDLAEALGCEIFEAGAALVVRSDPVTRETTVPGVYVAGDAGNSPAQSVVLAAASGASAATFANLVLAAEDAEAEVSAAVGGGRE
jgi:thioredoxin reductase